MIFTQNVTLSNVLCHYIRRYQVSAVFAGTYENDEAQAVGMGGEQGDTVARDTRVFEVKTQMRHDMTGGRMSPRRIKRCFYEDNAVLCTRVFEGIIRVIGKVKGLLLRALGPSWRRGVLQSAKCARGGKFVGGNRCPVGGENIQPPVTLTAIQKIMKIVIRGCPVGGENICVGDMLTVKLYEIKIGRAA